METVIIVIHLMVVVALVAVVLVQRSEGGGLGIGGGSGFMTARGAANALTRTTAILAAIFFATSLGLSIMARYQGSVADILDNAPASNSAPQNNSGNGSGKGILDQLGGAPATKSPAKGVNEPTTVPNGAPATQTAPATTTPAAPTTTTPSAPATNGSANPAAPTSGDASGTQAPAPSGVPNQ